MNFTLTFDPFSQGMEVEKKTIKFTGYRLSRLNARAFYGAVQIKSTVTKNGIKTIMDLQNQDPNILYNKLRNRADNTKPLPTLGMIQH